MHLILAFVWLFLAGVFFYWSWRIPDAGMSTRVMLGGCLGLLFSAYNIFRWWMRRQRMIRQKQGYDNPLLRPRREEEDDMFFRDHEEGDEQK